MEQGVPVVLPLLNLHTLGLAKAGDGKADIVRTVLQTLKDNEPPTPNSEQVLIGGEPGKPVILNRSNVESADYFVQQARLGRGNNNQAPIYQFIDVAKELYGVIPRRSNKQRNTVDELARDVVWDTIKKYHFQGVEFICLTTDVAAFPSLIPRAKRKKADAIKSAHGKLSQIRKGSDDLRLGTVIDHASLLVATVNSSRCYSTLSATKRSLLRIKSGNCPSRFIQPFVLAVVGGSPDSCVAIGVGSKQSIRLNASTAEVSCQDIQKEVRRSEIVKKEEGEVTMCIQLWNQYTDWDSITRRVAMA